MPPGRRIKTTASRLIDRDVAIIDREERRPQGFEAADDEAAEKGAGHRADAAHDGGDQGFQAERGRSAIADAAIKDGHDETGKAGHGAGHGEGLGENRLGVDAEQFGGERIVGIGPPLAAETGSLSSRSTGRRPRSGRKRRRSARSASPRRRNRRLSPRAKGSFRIGLIQRSLPPWVRRRNSCRNRERPTAATSACWPVARWSGRKDEAAGGDAKGDSRGDRQQKGERHRTPGRESGGEKHAEGRGIAAGGGKFAEGEVDPPDEPIDQRIGRREQRVDRGERQAVDRLLQAVNQRHGAAPGRAAPRRAAQDRRRARPASPARNGSGSTVDRGSAAPRSVSIAIRSCERRGRPGSRKRHSA